MIGIVDYGMGNIESLRNALSYLGFDAIVTDNPETLSKSTHIILPGVGSFQAAVAEIEKRKLRKELTNLAMAKPFLGICLGMQLLFTTGFEGGKSDGLNFIPGTVEIIDTDLILPHIGWNTLQVEDQEELFGKYHNRPVYFVHSYGVKTSSEYIAASTDYGTEVPAIVKRDNIYGMQFHPEKSGEIGLSLLRTFLEAGSSFAK